MTSVLRAIRRAFARTRSKSSRRETPDRGRGTPRWVYSHTVSARPGATPAQVLMSLELAWRQAHSADAPCPAMTVRQFVGEEWGVYFQEAAQ